MKNEEIIKAALDEGFFSAAVVETDKLVFDYSFRKYCEENLCGQYGVCYSCPPRCGTPEEMHARLGAYPKALVFQSKWDNIKDFTPTAENTAKILAAKAKHNAALRRVADLMEKDGHKGVMAGASSCTLCDECAAEHDKPCLHPDRAFSCLSAYCVNVSKLAETCSMDFSPEDGSLTLYGVFTFI